MTHRYRFISAHRASYGVKRMCRVLDIRRQGYYEWLDAADARAERQRAEDDLAAEITAIHAAHQQGLRLPAGHRRTAPARPAGQPQDGSNGSCASVASSGWTRRRRRSLTKQDAHRATGAGPDRPRLHRRRAGPAVRRRHHLPAHRGGLALPGHRHRPAQPRSRRPRDGRAHARRTGQRRHRTGPPPRPDQPRRDLPLRPRIAIHLGRFPAQHSQTCTLRASMGRTGSCFDNAVAESFFATLKTEIGTKVWPTRHAARRAVFDYLTYYNQQPSTFDQRLPHTRRNPPRVSSGPRPRGMKPRCPVPGWNLIATAARTLVPAGTA